MKGERKQQQPLKINQKKKNNIVKKLFKYHKYIDENPFSTKEIEQENFEKTLVADKIALFNYLVLYRIQGK
jgi:hypothetical protein